MNNIYLLLAALLISNNIFAQTFVLSGRITDAQSGESLSYGNIRVLNTTLGTAANTNGDYELKLSRGEYSLVASYIGYYSDTISVNLSKDLREINFDWKKRKFFSPIL